MNTIKEALDSKVSAVQASIKKTHSEVGEIKTQIKTEMNEIKSLLKTMNEKKQE